MKQGRMSSWSILHAGEMKGVVTLLACISMKRMQFTKKGSCTKDVAVPIASTSLHYRLPAAYFCLARLICLFPTPQVIIAGNVTADGTQRLIDATHAHFAPDKVRLLAHSVLAGVGCT